MAFFIRQRLLFTLFLGALSFGFTAGRGVDGNALLVEFCMTLLAVFRRDSIAVVYLALVVYPFVDLAGGELTGWQGNAQDQQQCVWKVVTTHDTFLNSDSDKVRTLHAVT